MVERLEISKVQKVQAHTPRRKIDKRNHESRPCNPRNTQLQLLQQLLDLYEPGAWHISGTSVREQFARALSLK